MAKTVKTKVLLRNDTARRWTSNNPVLGKGEIGIEIDTRKFKFGDGTKTWTQLPYASAADVSWNSANKKLVKDDGTVDIVRFTEGTGIDLTATAAGLQIAVDKTELGLTAADIDLSSLVDTLTGTPGAGKTITAFDEVAGKVSATFGDIAIAATQVSGLADVATSGEAADVSTAAYTTGGGTPIAASTVQAELERLSTSVENAVAGSGEVNIIEGVKLEGRSSNLPLASKIATIPNAVATGTTGATNGLMTAADKAKLDSIPTTQSTLVAGAGIDITESGNNITISADVTGIDVGVTNVTYNTSTHTLSQAKNGGTATSIHQFGEAAEKSVDTSIASGSTSTNVPTSAAVASAINTAVQGLGNVFEYKGTVATVADLPANPAVGDVYHVTADDGEYVWVGAVSSGEAAHWEPLGGAVDLSAYLTSVKIGDLTATKASGVATFARADVSNELRKGTTLDSQDELILDCGDSTQEIPSR